MRIRQLVMRFVVGAIVVLWLDCAAWTSESIGDRRHLEVAFPINDRAAWMLPSDGRLTMTVDKEAANFCWAGGLASAEATTSDFLPLVPGPEFELRLELKTDVDRVEWGAQMTAFLLLFDQNRKLIESKEFDIGNSGMNGSETLRAVIPPAASRWLTFNPRYKTPPQAAFVKAGFRFGWNAMEVKVRSLSIAIVPKQQGWKPWEMTPEATLPTEQVNAILACRQKVVPKLMQRGERTELWINDQAVVPAFYKIPPHAVYRTRCGDFGTIGFPFVVLPINLGGGRGPLNSFYGPIWLGEGRYDYNLLEQTIRDVLAKNPKACIFLEFNISVCPEWGEQHPEEIETNIDGERGVIGGCRMARYGGDPPNVRKGIYEHAFEWWAASYFSEVFHRDVKRALRDIFGYLEEHDVGKVVAGCYLNGGCDGQWHPLSDSFPFGMSDYSPGALRSFHRWLRLKYQDNESSLQAAWGDPKVTFSSAAMPIGGCLGNEWRGRRYEERSPDPFDGRSFARAMGGSLQWSADYNRFLSEVNAWRAIAFAEGVKEGSRGRVLCGGYCPDSTTGYPLFHDAISILLQSKVIDFFSNCPGGRGDGLAPLAWNAVESIQLHGKLLIQEMDLRNPRKPNWGDDVGIDYISMPIWKGQILKFAGMAAARGQGYHLYDMDGGWFDDPETMAYLKEVIDSHQAVLNAPETNARQAAIFIDEKTPSYTCYRYRALSYDLVDNPMQAFLNSGVNVGVYQLEDAWNNRFTPPKVCAFLNATSLTPEQADTIRQKFGCDHRVIVWVWAPGIFAPGGNANPSRITGFQLIQDDMLFGKVIQVDKNTDPLMRNVKGLLGAQPWEDVPRYRVADPEAIPLANYVGTDAVGIAVKRHKNYTEVFIGQPGGFTPGLVRNLVWEARDTPMNAGDAVVFCGAGLLTVHAKRDGEHIMSLPSNITAVTCLTGQSCAFVNGKLKLDLPGGNTACFKTQ